MMIATNRQIKRMLQQLQSGAYNAFRTALKRGYAIGLAISYISTTLTITKQLNDENRLSPKMKDALRIAVSNAVKNHQLKIIQSDRAGKDVDQNDADFRHLRNCFAHANWKYSALGVMAGDLSLKLEDYSKKQNKTFETTMNLIDLIDLTQKLQIAAFTNIP